MSRITNRIFLGSARDAADIEFLERNKIGLVINFATEVPNPDWMKYVKNIDYVHFKLHDNSSQVIIPTILQVYDFLPTYLENTKKNVLFNCYAGISRSATALIGFIMLYLDLDLKTAYHIVKSKRNIIRPNSGFMEQLNFLDKNRYYKLWNH